MARALDRRKASEESSHSSDRSRWEKLISSANPSAMLAFIGSAMSQRLRESCTREDIWQETLAQAWRDRARSPHAEGPAAFRAWLLEIARNRIRQAARTLATQKRGAGQRPKRLSELSQTTAGTPAARMKGDSETPSRIAFRGEKRDALQVALSKLPPDEAQVIRLHLLEEKTMESIAGHLGIGLSAAWRRFRKGSATLARILPGWTGEASGTST